CFAAPSVNVGSAGGEVAGGVAGGGESTGAGGGGGAGGVGATAWIQLDTHADSGITFVKRSALSVLQSAGPLVMMPSSTSWPPASWDTRGPPLSPLQVPVRKSGGFTAHSCANESKYPSYWLQYDGSWPTVGAHWSISWT